MRLRVHRAAAGCPQRCCLKVNGESHEGRPSLFGSLLAQVLQLRVVDRSELLRVGLGSPSRNCPPKMPEMEPAMSLHTFVPQAT
jgi:hypothetical protein